MNYFVPNVSFTIFLFPSKNSLNLCLASQSVVIDDASAARVHKLLMIVNVVSNFPLIIVGLGGIMLVVFIILLIKAHQQKVQHLLLNQASF